MVSKPAWQQNGLTSKFRTSPDVSYDADPSTGFLVYDSLPAKGVSGWLVFGGTSAGAPHWAALLALADQGRAAAGQGSLGNAQALLYSLSRTDFNDITSGSNGAYSARTGYDLVTGLGSPKANLLIADLIKAKPVTTTTASTTGHSASASALSHDEMGGDIAGPSSAAVALDAGRAQTPAGGDLTAPSTDWSASLDALWSSLAAILGLSQDHEGAANTSLTAGSKETATLDLAFCLGLDLAGAQEAALASGK
jgi:hypothetical protein